MKKQLTNQELTYFCEQFAIVLRSGISSLEGLHLLMDDSGSDETKKFLASIIEDFQESGSLASSLEHCRLFPASMISYVKIGEETGCLDEVMESLSRHYRQETEISETIKSAITYPLLMLGMMVAVIVILLVKVLPVFQQVFRQMGMEMTGISGSLLKTGTAIGQCSTTLAVLSILLILVLLFLFFNQKGRTLLQKASYKLPYISRIPLALDYSRLTQGISMGLRSGLDYDTCLELSVELISHPFLKERTAKVQEQLKDGALFSDAMIDSGLFQGMNARLIAIGLHAGSAEEVMSKLSDRYQEESVNTISGIISVLEPTIVIVFSLLVGLVLLSVMMPLLGILSEIIV